MTQRLLAVFAHPDDESLLAGGTLAACSASGVEVEVISMTRGERAVAGGAPAGAAELGAVRELELREAAAALGVRRAECLDYPDGGLEWVAPGEGAGELAARISRRRPQAVITFGAEGLYWHPDHVAVHRLSTAALDATAGADPAASPPWVYAATWPDDLAARLVSRLQAEGLPADIWGLDPAAFGVAAESITTVVDIRAFLEPKLRALSMHASQLRQGHALAALPERLARDLLGHEYFIRLRAPAATPDWLSDTVESGTRLRAAS
ncbi:MAG: PIG-L deacetylase family protein [Solirubrobacteraceae bacterium]|jgi:LmbE family N-acetylglucosaminyl deacetylase